MRSANNTGRENSLGAGLVREGRGVRGTDHTGKIRVVDGCVGREGFVQTIQAKEKKESCLKKSVIRKIELTGRG